MVIDLSGRRVLVAGEVLHVLDGDALAEQVGHDHHPKAVRGEDRRQPGILQAPLEELPHGPRPDAPGAKPRLGVPVAPAKKRRLLRLERVLERPLQRGKPRSWTPSAREIAPFWGSEGLLPGHSGRLPIAVALSRGAVPGARRDVQVTGKASRLAGPREQAATGAAQDHVWKGKAER